MIKNYLKLFWRSIIKVKGFTALNIVGLSISIAASMLIILYTSHELSYDSFHKNIRKIFWIQGSSKTDLDISHSNRMGYYTAPLLKQFEPSVESYLRIANPLDNVTIQNPESKSVKYFEKNFLFADNTFFNFFSFEILKGDKNKILKNPFSIVISSGAAKRYFGNNEAIGKVLRYNNKYNFLITGIVKDPPSNSSLKFNFVASLSSFVEMEKEMISNQSQTVQMGFFNTYVLLNAPSSRVRAERSLNTLYKNTSLNIQDSESFQVLPFSEMHLNPYISDFSNNKYLKVLPLIACVILILAVINYVSLATSKSTLRAKEIGVRKVLGASTKQIAIQFFFESFLFSCVSFVLGYIMCLLIQKPFFNFIQIDINDSFLYSMKMFFYFGILLLFTAFLASIYPAILQSKFMPAEVLSGKFNISSGALTRKIFTVFQFALCVSLLVCGLVVKKQLYFIKHADTGINRSNIVVIPFDSTIGNHLTSFRNSIASLSSIKKVAFSTNPLFKGYETYFVNSKNDNSIALSVIHVDESFIPLLKLKWKISPNDSVSFLSEKSIILNETAAEQLNLNNHVLDEKISLASHDFEIAGLLKDFNYESLEKRIGALALVVDKYDNSATSWLKYGGFLYAEILPKDIGIGLHKIEEQYKKFDSENPFDYYFLDEAFNEMYKTEEKISNLAAIFIVIALLISCLGLFGLSIFSAQLRIKEISIRKILGASVSNLVIMQSFDFIKLILVAVLLACPIAWWVSNHWLQSFAYRIATQADVIVISCLIAILTAVLTVSWQAFKTAMANPLKSIRND